jgi:hypothetical protein
VPELRLDGEPVRRRLRDLWRGPGRRAAVAFAAPIIGGVIAGLFAYQAHNDCDLVRRNLCLIAVGWRS